MNKSFLLLNGLHILNDGYKASFLLLLPFIAKDFQLNLATVGFLATIVNGVTTILAIPVGYLSGKYGGLKILLFSLFVYAVGFIMTGFVQTPFFLPITFFLTALGFGAFHTICFALVARLSNPEKRGKQMGEFMATGDIGRIGLAAFIPTLAGWVGWHIGAIIFGFVALFFGVLAQILGGKDVILEGQSDKKQQDIGFKEIIKDKQYLLVTIAGIFDTFASGSLYIFIPFLLLQRHIPIGWLGLFTGLFFLGNIFGKTILGRFIDTYGNEKVFIVSEILMAIFILILSNVSFLAGIVVAATVLGVFTKGTAPIIQVMISDTAKSHGNYEKTFALNNFSNSIAALVAPILLGFLADTYSIFFAFTISALFAILAIFPALGVRWIRRKNAQEQAAIQKTE